MQLKMAIGPKLLNKVTGNIFTCYHPQKSRSLLGVREQQGHNVSGRKLKLQDNPNADLIFATLSMKKEIL